jgi:hypothetical protein
MKYTHVELSKQQEVTDSIAYTIWEEVLLTGSSIATFSYTLLLCCVVLCRCGCSAVCGVISRFRISCSCCSDKLMQDFCPIYSHLKQTRQHFNLMATKTASVLLFIFIIKHSDEILSSVQLVAAHCRSVVTVIDWTPFRFNQCHGLRRDAKRFGHFEE